MPSTEIHPATTFASLLVASRKRRGDSQLAFADWLNADMEARGYDLTRPFMSTSQAAVSKWEDPAIAYHPTEPKWASVARYCRVSEGVIARLCGDPLNSSNAAVLREALVDSRTELRMKEIRLEELTSIAAEQDDELARLRKLREKDRAKLRSLQETLDRTMGDLARLRAASPAARRRATAS